MKAFNLINLYNAEISKNNLLNVRGGADVKCICGGYNAPAFSVYNQGPSNEVCLCPDTASYVSTKNRAGNA